MAESRALECLRVTCCRNVKNGGDVPDLLNGKVEVEEAKFVPEKDSLNFSNCLFLVR